MLKTYYQLLGLQSGYSIDELKQAYRKRAKELHPDKNKALNAHEQFVLLGEAYSYLLKLKQSNKSGKTLEQTTEEWIQRERQKARQRAADQARMKYKEFIKTPEYQALNSVFVIGEHLAFLFAIFMMGVFPVINTFLYGIKGFGVAVLLLVVTLPITVKGIKNRSKLNFVKFFKSLFVVFKTKAFLIFFLTFSNLLVFLKIGLNTVISIYLLMAIFILPMIVFFTLSFWIKKYFSAKRYFITFCFIPFTVNAFLSINYFFSKNPVLETYYFKKEMHASTAGWQESTYVFLEGDAYLDCQGIRAFWDYEKMAQKSRVSYVFCEGLFGWRVMRDYKFD